ncbi:NAD(+)/NADH kinase [Candidatus Woesearchaeota archaeon]|nr:NAD(+)/NADH kinase [Candidatus Woesearchaeota archaeon]
MYLVTSNKNRESLELAKIVLSYLKQNKMKAASDSELKLDFEMIFAIGDDRFLLETFRKLGKNQKPVLPIASSQSFFAQVNSLNIKHYLNLLKKNKFELYKRSRLEAKFDKSSSPIALNDIGLFSSKSASLLRYTLYLNNEIFWKETGDGLIISTPTGSTGYSLSAGGPIIVGEPNIFSVTPISSLEKHSPAIVSDSAKIRISDIEGDRPLLIIDGEIRMPVKSNELIIERSQHDANFVIFSKEHQLESKLKKRTLHLDMGKIKGLPASSKLLYRILMHEGNMTQKELVNASALPERTARYALALLVSKGLVSTQTHFTDARQTVYGV